MFSSLRSTSILVFGVVMVLTLFFAFYFKSAMIKNVVSQNIEEKGVVISKAYNGSIWDKYAPVVDYVDSLDDSEKNGITQFNSFIRETQNFFTIDKLAKITVYNNSADVLFDSHPEISIISGNGFLDGLFLGNTDVDIAQTQALKGKTAMAIMTGAAVNNSGSEVGESIIKIFVPIQSQISKKGNVQPVKGIIELNFVITESMSFLLGVQIYIILSVFLISSAVLSVLFYSSRKAEEVMEKQQEASVELAAAKATAESESRAKSQFLANVSHELRTPLNAIIGFSEIINNESMGPIGNDDYKEFVQDIHTSGVHLLSLINDILDFSKAEENKLSVDFEQIDITKLVKICMRMVLPRAENAKVALKDEVPQEHFVLMADQKRLKQVILNLLSNAVKFTSEGGEVMIRVWKDIATNSIVIEVKDTGVGMAPQDLARALSPFGQVDNKLSRRYEGTGLGLPLTKKLVELMRGKFDIRSEVGLGTTVLLYFPLQDEDMQEISNIYGHDAIDAPKASEESEPQEESNSAPEAVEEVSKPNIEQPAAQPVQPVEQAVAPVAAPEVNQVPTSEPVPQPAPTMESAPVENTAVPPVPSEAPPVVDAPAAPSNPEPIAPNDSPDSDPKN